MRNNRILTALAAPLLLAGCAKDGPAVRTDVPDCEVVLSVEGESLSPDTRSVLPSTDAFEKKITDVTVLAYTSAGTLETAEYYTSTGSFTISLSRETGHTLYLFVNMGALRSSATNAESGVGNVSWTIPSYSSVSSKGIPMAGKKAISAGATTASINVRRLMAKLLLTVDHGGMASGGDDQAFRNGTVRLKNAARTLRPFASGGSRAQGASELFTGDTDYADLSGNAFATPSETVVLYVPENRQGTLLGQGAGTLDKSLSNAALSGQGASALCTWLEFKGTKVGGKDGVSGALTYRFFPGADPARNFDLEGGKRYDITLVLTWDGMFIDGNWMVERSDGWSDTRLIQVSERSDGGWAEEIRLSLPPGVQDYPYYVLYTPSGGSSPHASYGWTFTFDGRTAPSNSSIITAADGIQVGYSSHTSAWSIQKISIPLDDGLYYQSREVVCHTVDGRHRATVHVDIVEPEIIISPTTVTRQWNEYGSSSAFTVRVVGGNVPPSQITVRGSGGELYVSSYDPGTGQVTGYWKSANGTSTQRRGYIWFEGLDAAVACTVLQGARSAFIVNDDTDEGEADNTYD